MSKQIYFDAMKEKGKLDAADLQTRSAGMTGTELYAQDGKIPSFAAAVVRKNMLERKVGFVCRSTAGRVVKLLQNYDSTVYPQEPEDLPAQWGFQWSTDPKKALPFIDGHVWRSGQDNNVWAPGTVGVKWDDLGEIEEVMEAD